MMLLSILEALLTVPEHKPATRADALALGPVEAVRAFCAWSRQYNSLRADADDVDGDTIVEMLRDGIAIQRATTQAP
jgi:hypothetical protein